MREEIEKLVADIERRHAELAKQEEPEPRGGYAPWAANVGRVLGQLQELENFREELYRILHEHTNEN